MKRMIQSIFTVGTLFCAAGCLSTVDTVENWEKTYVANEVIRKHVETDANTPIRVIDLVDATDPNNGFLKIAVTLSNRSTSPRSARYQCEWYDENGMSVMTSLTHWSEIRLAGRDSRQVRFTAPNARAKDYKIRLLEIR